MIPDDLPGELQSEQGAVVGQVASSTRDSTFNPTVSAPSSVTTDTEHSLLPVNVTTTNVYVDTTTTHIPVAEEDKGNASRTINATGKCVSRLLT